MAVLVERVQNLKDDLDSKHTQNRKDIHLMRSEIQALSNQIWLIKLKLAAYAGVGGLVGAGGITGLIKLIEHLSNK